MYSRLKNSTSAKCCGINVSRPSVFFRNMVSKINQNKAFKNQNNHPTTTSNEGLDGVLISSHEVKKMTGRKRLHSA